MFYDSRGGEGYSEIITLENKNLDVFHVYGKNKGTRYVDRGIGFAYGNKNNLLEKAKKLSKLSDFRGKFVEKPVVKEKVRAKFYDIDIEEKIRFVKELGGMIRGKNISYKSITFQSLSSKNIYEDSYGSEIEYEKNLMLLYVRISGGKELQQSFFSLGTQKGFKFFEKIGLEKKVDKLIKRHEKLLSAKRAPAGRHPVIIDPVLAGVFFHEAVGHACEADAILNKASVFAGKKGHKIAPEILNMSDDPSIKAFGHYKYDDEGIKAKETKLIENGVLTGFLHSLETASRMKEEPTGNGRVQNPNNYPIPRMSNIVIKKGDSGFEEMVQEMKDGIYLIGSKGGVVEPLTGNFLFNAEYGYVIKNGEKKHMIKDVSLSGNILETLKNIKLIGKKPMMSPRTSFCGKMGQSVPVSEKTPFIYLSEAVIGGY